MNAEASKIVPDTLTEHKLEGYFLFYRAKPKKTDSDVTIPGYIYDVFYIRDNSVGIDFFSNFADTSLLDTTKFIGISAVYGDTWTSLKPERDSTLKLIEKKYPFNKVHLYNFQSLVQNAIPQELIDSDKAFISILKGEIYSSTKIFSADHGFSNTNEFNYGTSSTFLLLPNERNHMEYCYSIEYK